MRSFCAFCGRTFLDGEYYFHLSSGKCCSDYHLESAGYRMVDGVWGRY